MAWRPAGRHAMLLLSRFGRRLRQPVCAEPGDLCAALSSNLSTGEMW